MDALSLQPRRSPGARCAVCHDALDAAAMHECPGCRTALHESCRKDLARCPTIGCWEPAAPKEREVDPNLVPAQEPPSWRRTLIVVGASTLAFGLAFAVPLGIAKGGLAAYLSMEVFAATALGHLFFLPVWAVERSLRFGGCGALLFQIAGVIAFACSAESLGAAALWVLVLEPALAALALRALAGRNHARAPEAGAPGAP